MVKKIVLFLLYGLLYSNYSQAQKLKRYDDILLFKEAKSQQPIIIVNDSLVYKNGTLLPFKHTEYPDKISEYLPFEIGTKSYLVHQGCGPVLEFRNDSLVRIDKSYMHRNQFGATPFVYKNEIYFFGGYGLFTFKNIITRYNFKSGEWNQEQTYGEHLPEPRCCEANSFKKNNIMYLFGGITNDVKNNRKTKPVAPILWRLDLSSMTWNNLGFYNSELLNSSYHTLQVKDKLYLFNEMVIEIDFIKNTINKYDFSSHILPKLIYASGDTICGIFEDNKGELYFDKKTIQEIKGKNKGIFPLISISKNDSINNYWVGIFLLILILTPTTIYYRRKFSPQSLQKILYNIETKEFSYKNKTIFLFEENEKKILHFLLENNDEFVSLNKLNELFENPAQPESISATIKRREQAVNGLLVKVAKITGLEEGNLISIRKNTEDKRLKDLLLLPKLLKKV